MNLFVWIALYFLVGSFGWGLKDRTSKIKDPNDYAILMSLVVAWPVFVIGWLVVLPFRFGQWIGRRWPR